MLLQQPCLEILKFLKEVFVLDDLDVTDRMYLNQWLSLHGHDAFHVMIHDDELKVQQSAAAFDFVRLGSVLSSHTTLDPFARGPAPMNHPVMIRFVLHVMSCSEVIWSEGESIEKTVLNSGKDDHHNVFSDHKANTKKLLKILKKDLMEGVGFLTRVK